MRLRTITFCLAILSSTTASLSAQGTIDSIQPRTCQPGQTTRLTLHGKELNDALRVVASSTTANVQIQAIETQQALVDVTLAKDAPLGPMGLWLATAGGPQPPRIVIVDDLSTVTDNGNNHSVESAQSISTLCAIEGLCEGAHSDFYQIDVTAGQRVAVEIRTQELLSAMDPVIRLLDADQRTLLLLDDDATGPDCRFSYEFPEAGKYWLEISDSRHAAAGAPYHLRIGDFPVVRHAYPMVVQCGQNQKVEFIGPDGALVSAGEVEMPTTLDSPQAVSARMEGGKSSTWTTVWSSPHLQWVEQVSPNPEEPFALPLGINGRLSQPNESDSYRLQGQKDQTIRVVSRTRSLGCPTLLEMRLFNAAGAKVAETKVSEVDEWSFDYKFPDDGEYRLEVSDLLKRGGAEFSYWVEMTPAGSFAVALKADKANREQFAMEPEHGACAIDLQIARFGYDGEIELSLVEAVAGIRILNPRIPAKATEARIYLVAESSWSPSQLRALRLQAQAVGNQAVRDRVDSRALHRAQNPFVLTNSTWNDGAIVLASVAPSESPFALQPASPVHFARQLKTHTASLALRRIKPEFKGNVTLLDNQLPTGWSASTKVDKDNYTATFSSSQTTDAPIEELSLLVFGEFNGRGRVESLSVPIEWIDPVKVHLEWPQPLVRGGRAKLRVNIARQGNDPQPLKLTLLDSPPGVNGPAEPLEVAADQTHVDIELKLAADLTAATETQLKVSAASKFAGQDFSIESDPIAMPEILESPQQLTVYPTEMEFGDPRGRQQVVVLGHDSQQAARDWTRFARLTSADSTIAEVRGSVVFPKSNGETELKIEVGGAHHSIPIRVANADSPRPIAFESETLVALSKQGCNSGACHGSPSGKGGFRLSLRAFDKQLDELTLIREDFGRRVNTLEPEESLLLLKPMMNVAHGGGKQLHRQDAAYQILRDWIAEGAQTDPADTPRVTRLEVFPSQKQILTVADGGQQLAITAHFADGSHRDVTDLAAYESSDTNVATVDVNGFVTPHGRGEIAILARFLEHIESVPLMFVENQAGFEWKSRPPNNYVDELVNDKLRQLQYLPSPTCTDAEFLRRVSLDVTGVLPTTEQTTAFLADSSPDKRSRWVDQLLESEEYPKFWALKWGDLLRMTGKLVGDEGVYKYHRWVEQSLRENMPYDEFAKELLTATGSTLANPPANFYRTATDMNECVETISQVFLGARLQCAKCHNHPFERWTQDNYYGLGAFFDRVQRRNTERPGEMFVFTSYTGEVTQPRTGKVAAPWLPQVGNIEPHDQDRRMAFADWLVDPNNPYFARIEANRIWSHFFSRGIVDPIDDFRDSNPPSNAPLLDALAKDFVDSGYDRKHLMRVILASRTYQASYQTNEYNQEDLIYFSHQEPRLLSAEQLLDAINQTLGLTQQFANLPSGTRATQLPAPDVVKVEFLKVFGQPERSTVCACERADDSNLGMAIELFNGSMIHEKLRDEQNRFRVSLAAGRTTEEVIRELYLAAVCRPPSDIELRAALEHCARSPDPVAGLEDVCWALFNTDEFLFQH